MAKVMNKSGMPAPHPQKSGFTYNLSSGGMRQAPYSPMANNVNASRSAGVCVGPGGMKQIGSGEDKY